MDDNWRDRYGLIDWKGLLLTPEQILEKCQTAEGRNEVKDYIMKARVAFTTQTMLEDLGVTLTADQMQKCCLTLWEGLFRVPIDAVMEYAKQAAEGLEQMDEEKYGGHA